MQHVIIPDTYLDLLNGPIVASIATIMPNGYPQVTPVWCLLKEGMIYTTTGRNFQKRRNMSNNPKVTLFIFHPMNHLRYLEIRGIVDEISEEGAIACLDELCMIYTGMTPYYGKLVDASLKDEEHQVLVKIRPIRVNGRDFR